MLDLARLAEVYGQREIRLTVEQNVIIPHIATENLNAFLGEPLFERIPIKPEPLQRGLVSLYWGLNSAISL